MLCFARSLCSLGPAGQAWPSARPLSACGGGWGLSAVVRVTNGKVHVPTNTVAHTSSPVEGFLKKTVQNNWKGRLVGITVGKNQYRIERK